MNAISEIRQEPRAFDALTAKLRAATDRLTEREIANGAAHYVRSRDLVKLFPRSVDWPEETIIPKLENAIRASRNMLASGHWAASRDRLVALKMALEGEMRR